MEIYPKACASLNGIYTQASNRRHQRVGHLFPGRFKAILVDSDAYLLEVSRYVVLNPVRAGMVKKSEDWMWSSYRATAGLADSVPWLAVDGILAQFAKRRSAADVRIVRPGCFQFGSQMVQVRGMGTQQFPGLCAPLFKFPLPLPGTEANLVNLFMDLLIVDGPSR